MDQALRFGQVAERSAVSIDTVRYYERRRLLPAAPRTANGYRMFTSESVERVLFIKQAQELGFSLDEIGALLITDGSNDCLRVHEGRLGGGVFTAGALSRCSHPVSDHPVSETLPPLLRQEGSLNATPP